MSILIELQPTAGPVLVVGGGAVALRRASRFIAGGFDVDVVAPVFAAGFSQLPSARLIVRAFESSDIADHILVCACTGDRDVNARIGDLARRRRIPVVVADRQEESTFFMPAVHRDGSLVVGVGTGGASPSLARDIRDRIAECLGEGWASRVDGARNERKSRLNSESAP